MLQALYKLFNKAPRVDPNRVDVYVGTGTSIKGEITLRGNVVIAGLVDGTILPHEDSVNQITVEAGGVVTSKKIECTALVIRGFVDAEEVECVDLTIQDKGSLSAKTIVYRNLSINPGAVLAGTLEQAVVEASS